MCPTCFFEDGILSGLIHQLYRIGLSKLDSCALSNQTVVPTYMLIILGPLKLLLKEL